MQATSNKTQASTRKIYFFNIPFQDRTIVCILVGMSNGTFSQFGSQNKANGGSQCPSLWPFCPENSGRRLLGCAGIYKRVHCFLTMNGTSMGCK